MQPTEENGTQFKVQTVAALAAAYFSNNHVSQNDVPSILSLFSTEVDKLMGATVAPAQAEKERPAPAVPIKKSIQPDYLVSLFDGRRLKSLKRYLRTAHNMSPEEYRAHWGLPRDYPMTAPNYAAKRSELAKKIGLGQKGGPRRTKDAAAPDAAAAPKAPKAARKAPTRARKPADQAPAAAAAPAEAAA